jgi:hypothetical protein
MEEVQPEDAPVATAPPPRDLGPVANILPPQTDLREQWLKVLRESPALADKLEAARHIAARGNEAAFVDLATFIAAAEATGDDTLVDIARQVAGILAQMRGTEIQAAATEFAYSPSALVAEAAVNAAVAAEPGTTPQWVDSGSFQNPADQKALDALLQELADRNRKEVPPLLEK